MSMPSARSALAVGALTAILALTVGCAADDSTPASGTAGETTGSTAPDETSGSAGQNPGTGQAVKLTYRKTGGLRALDETTTYAFDTAPPSGSSQADVRTILGAASDPALRDLELTPLPKNPCCDLQEYTVTIAYADGTDQTFRTVDGVQQPRVFESLLSMLG